MDGCQKVEEPLGHRAALDLSNRGMGRAAPRGSAGRVRW